MEKYITTEDGQYSTHATHIVLLSSFIISLFRHSSLYCIDKTVK